MLSYIQQNTRTTIKCT